MQPRWRERNPDASDIVAAYLLQPHRDRLQGRPLLRLFLAAMSTATGQVEPRGVVRDAQQAVEQTERSCHRCEQRSPVRKVACKRSDDYVPVVEVDQTLRSLYQK